MIVTVEDELDRPTGDLVGPAGEGNEGAGAVLLGMNRYQWTVLFAAWLGWGFDIFDGLLFTFVAPNCIPTLLGQTIGSPEARASTFYYTGLFTSLLLLGWAAGGILFGRVADRIGRTKTLALTMLTYSLGTALCAFAPNLWALALFRLIASLGIGGEWAAGASLVNEVVPKERRVEAGALLYTSAPMGLFLADFVNFHLPFVEPASRLGQYLDQNPGFVLVTFFSGIADDRRVGVIKAGLMR